jgi:hypothetical protein
LPASRALRPAGAPVHEHLRDVAAMRLILGLSQNDLNGADDRAVRVFGREHDAFAARDTFGRTPPECVRLGAGHREHKTDRRATFDAVDQHVAQALDLSITDLFQRSNPDRGAHRYSHSIVPGGFDVTS